MVNKNHNYNTCIIDFGQSYVKFILIDKKKFIPKVIFKIKNNFVKKKNNFLFYNLNKIKQNIKRILKEKKYRAINKLSFSCHGSTYFIQNKNFEIESGFHPENSFFSFDKKGIINEQMQTLTPNFSKFHNMGKNIYYFLNKVKIKFLFTFPSMLVYHFTKKKISPEKTYMGCHTYLWDFKNKKLSNFYKILKKKNDNKNLFFNISKTGDYVGSYRNDINSKLVKVYNGGHDTSLSLCWHENFFKKNTIYLISGSWLIFAKEINKQKFIYNKSLYGLNTVRKQYLCARFDYRKYNKNIIKIKSLVYQNLLLLKKSFNKKKYYENFDLVIDGKLTENKNILRYVKKIKFIKNIFLFKYDNSPSLGIAKLALKKKNFYLKDYYNKSV